MLGCWKTRVRVRCYVRCSKPNDLTCVRLILTCSVSNVCWTEDVSVLVRWKDVLFCSMLDRRWVGWQGLLAGWAGWLAGWPGWPVGWPGGQLADVRC